MRRAPLPIVVDIGASRIRVGDSRAIAPAVEETTEETAATLIEQVASLVSEAAAGRPDFSVYIACPGIVEPPGRVVRALYVPLTGVDLRGSLHGRLGDRRIVVLNDATAQALGSARETELLLYVALGTAIGGAIVHCGRALAGRSAAAGEIGHMTALAVAERCHCGRRGCLDVVASGRALEAKLGRRWYEERAMRDQDSKLLKEAGAALGAVLVDCALLLAPDRVVVGGNLTSQHNFAAAVQAGYEQRPWGDAPLEFVHSTWAITGRGLLRHGAHKEKR